MRAAVLGSPVVHSLSPVLHAAAYRELGLTGWTYDRVELREDDLEPFLDGLGAEWAGLSLTMPLKQAVVPLLDEISPLAAVVGAVNTVTFAPGHPHGDPAVRARRGDNTDVAGIAQALAAAGATRPSAGVVLGGGATAASALAALHGLGCSEVVVCARSVARSHAVRRAGERLGLAVEVRPVERAVDALAAADVVVSSVPAGGLDWLASSLRPARPGAVLLDVVYDPWPTALAAAWRRQGGLVVAGLDMLVHQAVEQVQLMTGLRPSAAVLAAAVTGSR